MLPAEVRDSLERALGPVREASAVAGGCVSPAARVESPNGPIFLKYEERPPAGFFAAEARGLEAIRAAGTSLVVPRVIATHEPPGDWSWLALEWLETKSAWEDADWEGLGLGLAELHRSVGRSWGTPGWAEFWWARRIEPQLRLAGGAVGANRSWDRLQAALPELLGEPRLDGPSLLHGDLWSGNVVPTTRGPAIIDPSSYHGHREVDLAMAELFGGFTPTFHRAYREAWPLRAGYEVRRGVYQLYYLLVHVNLFGGGYADRTLASLRAVLERV
jgi:protein-ribulosamine 3-kinase